MSAQSPFILFLMSCCLAPQDGILQTNSSAERDSLYLQATAWLQDHLDLFNA